MPRIVVSSPLELMNRVILILCLIFMALPVAAALDCSGAWQTTYGEVILRQNDGQVTGSYYDGGATINGVMRDNTLSFHYDEGTVRGVGEFTFAEDGKSFDGRWRTAGSSTWAEWVGSRNDPASANGVATSRFDGVFNTSYGMMRLNCSDTLVNGIYAYSDSSSLSGSVTGNRLTFRYVEPDTFGEGWFELSADGNSFAGQWRADGQKDWSSWSGTRVVAGENEKWLVIFETAWEESLRDAPYAFGEMLETFFKRAPAVRVRRRAVSSAVDFRRAARDLAYLTGPVVVLLSGHGDIDGFIAGRDHLAASEIAEAVARNPEIILLNFSCCSAMAGESPRQVRDLLPSGHPCTISGYTTAVDWAASAGLEFLYLDCILVRDMSPVDAAALIRKELRFAGETGTNDSPFGGLGFSVIPPSR